MMNNLWKLLTIKIYLIYNTLAYLGRFLLINNVFICKNFSNLTALSEKNNKHPIKR